MRRSDFQTTNLVSIILKRVRARGKISRVELARDLGLAPSTAGLYVERLLEDGYLLESGETTGDAGRPPRLLRTNPEGGEFIGVDFEARNIMAVAVDFSDRPLRDAHKSIEETDSVEQVIAKIEAAIHEVLPPAGHRILAIGVGVPGIVDSRRGVALHYKHLTKWVNVRLAERLHGRFSVPVFLENNARTMALAELWFGQGKGHNDFLCVGIRSGLGAGLVLNGHLYCGAHHAAGELGHWRYPGLARAMVSWFGSQPNDSGTTEIELEDVASVRALRQALQNAMAQGKKSVLSSCKLPLSVTDVVKACQQRDNLAIRVTGEAAAALGWAIGQLSLAIDPEKIVLSGPLTALGEMFLQPLRAIVGQSLAAAATPAPEIVNSTMGEFSGALGAAALALHEWKPVRGNRPKGGRVDRLKKPASPARRTNRKG